MKRLFWHPATKIFLSLVLIGVIVAAYFAYRWFTQPNERALGLLGRLRGFDFEEDWTFEAGTRCGEAPFSMPTYGYIGYIWADSFRIGHRHQGLDIFGLAEPGVVPVYAAYSGYLTRASDWVSTVIIRIPSDPLNPGRQIWTYYTHMASPEGESFIVAEFPKGISEVYVEEGTLLGYQGNYTGDSYNPTGVHLHFSIVKDDGDGNFLNELEIKNTLDPSPYFGMALNAKENPGQIPVCEPQE
jgi:murein DD-endopeptidase MepM/ murein hydrolase activator NlpD